MPNAPAAALAIPVRRAAAHALALLCLPLLALPAQRVTGAGAGADAVVLPAGVLRVGVQGQLDSWREAYGSGANGAPTTSSAPLGARFSSGDLGSSEVGALSLIESSLRSLTGLSGLAVSLGDVRVRAEARRSTVPVRFDLGLGHRLQLSAMVPYVETRVEMATVANRTGERGNLGANPAIADPSAAGRTSALVNQIRSSADALDAAIAACGEGVASPACADPDAARAANAAALSFAAELAALYGLVAGEGAPLVPRTGSDAATAIQARIDALRATYGAYDVALIEAGASPANASQPLTGNSFASALRDLGIPAPGTSTMYGVGDIELGARFLVWDGFRGDLARATNPTGFVARASIDGLVRLGTGKPADAEKLLSVGTGDGQTDLEVGAVADLVFGRRFWASAAIRYGVQLEGEQTVRVPATAEESYTADASVARVRRDPGDYLELQVTPRVTLGDFIGLSASYSYRRRGADALSAVESSPDAAPLALDLLGRSFEGDEHRGAIGLTVSTLSAYAAGRVRMPLDVSYVHSRTLAGSGFATPKLSRDEVTLRIYLSAFGRGGR